MVGSSWRPYIQRPLPTPIPTAYARRLSFAGDRSPVSLAAPARPSTAAQSASITERQRADANRLIDAALRDTPAYVAARRRSRIGSAIASAVRRRSRTRSIGSSSEMRADGLANVRGEPVMVPHWVRGEESVTLVSPRVGAAAHARAGHERRHAGGRNHGAGARRRAASRICSGTPPRRRARSCCSTIRFRTNVAPMEGYRQRGRVSRRRAGGGGEGRRGRDADSIGRVVLDSESAHRLDALRHAPSPRFPRRR